MTAHDQMRAMLDQLMGTARNGEEDKITIRFDDTKVCKSFLLGCCPHEILASTRMDLGDCPKFHNVALRADYEKAFLSKDYFYDLDAVEQLTAFISDADRKTEQAKKRLAETQEELSTDVSIKADKVHELAEKIGENLAKAEQLGADGFVDESMKLMSEIDDLKRLKSEAEQEYRASIPAATYQQQKLRVCEVCCAYLGIHDNDRRLADHFGGKLHLGFIKIRETLKDFQIKLEERRKIRRIDYNNKKKLQKIVDMDNNWSKSTSTTSKRYNDNNREYDDDKERDEKWRKKMKKERSREQSSYHSSSSTSTSTSYRRHKSRSPQQQQQPIRKSHGRKKSSEEEAGEII